MDIVEALTALDATWPLIPAARRGHITSLACAMPICSCPKGRSYFESCRTKSRWAPSPDRWPVPGRAGGAYAHSNVRLAHVHCNMAEGQRITTANLTREQRRLAMRKWMDTPEGRASVIRAGHIGGGSAARRAYLATDEGRESIARAARLGGEATRRAACQRRIMNLGHSCSCGAHATTN